MGSNLWHTISNDSVYDATPAQGLLWPEGPRRGSARSWPLSVWRRRRWRSSALRPDISLVPMVNGVSKKIQHIKTPSKSCIEVLFHTTKIRKSDGSSKFNKLCINGLKAIYRLSAESVIIQFLQLALLFAIRTILSCINCRYWRSSSLYKVSIIW